MNYDNMLPRPTDSEVAARWSIEATQEGRYELAESLLRIAMQAYRSEKRDAVAQQPYAGPQLVRDVPPSPALVELVGYGNQSSPTTIPPNATAVIQMPKPPVIVGPDGVDRRCRATVLQGALEAECHGAVHWDHTSHRWYHLDAELDKDHYPAVRDGE